MPYRENQALYFLHVIEYMQMATEMHSRLRSNTMENLNFRQASRFLDMATFGIRNGQVEPLMLSQRSSWIEDQINSPISSHQQRLEFQMQQRGKSKPSQEMRVAAWFDLAIFEQDQLRQRMGLCFESAIGSIRKRYEYRTVPHGKWLVITIC